MIKIISAKYVGDFRIALEFSDGLTGCYDGRQLLARSGSLLEPLRAEPFFRRFFLDCGALCWPNGLELSPARLHDSVLVTEPA